MTDLGFTLTMHRAAAPDATKNACWSPYSVASALGLVTVGARGITRDELAVLLCGEKSADITELGTLLTKAAQLDDDTSVLAVANTLWVDKTIEVREAFATDSPDGVTAMCGRHRSGPRRRRPGS